MMAVTSEDFDQQVAHGRVLVDIWSQGCTRCLALTPHVEQIDREQESLRVLTLEAPNARRLCMRLKVAGLPTLLFYEDGVESARISNPDLDEEKLRTWLSTLI